MAAVAERQLWTLGSSVILRIPWDWYTSDFVPPAKVKLVYDGKKIVITPTMETEVRP